MIDFIEGRLAYKSNKDIVLVCNGIGYSIIMSEYEIRSISLDENMKIFTRLIVREDSLTLYGFLDRNSRTLFDFLTTVSTIGPKVAMGILSNMEIVNIVKYIKTSNIEQLTKAPGIGKKTAQRIILELKDKLDGFDFLLAKTEDDFEEYEENLDKEPAIEALTNLGYNKYEASKALEKVDMSLDISEIIKQALKNLGR